MKKFLALLLALTMVFALAACGSETVTEDAAEAVTDEVNAAEEETALVEDEAQTEAVTEELTTEEPTTEEPTTEAAEADPSAWTTEEIVKYYNEAVIKTNANGKISGANTMKLNGDITGDGALGTVLKIASPIIEKTLARNSTTQEEIPGKGALKAEDVQSAKASLSNGKIAISITLKNQVDGPTADAENGGSVARGIGTLGNLEVALNELGAELYSGRETVRLTYDNAYIKATINPESGLITGGNWHYNVNIYVGDAQIKLGIKFNAKNLKGIIDWNITY